ncbi:MAG: POTRA domain-containing protein [Terriglobales bacterium]
MGRLQVLLLAAALATAVAAAAQPACPNNQPTVPLRDLKIGGRVASPDSLSFLPMFGREYCLADLVNEAGERLRRAYQENGYFKAQVRVEIESVTARGAALYARVDAGPQYRLSEIQFAGARMFAPAELRSLFTLQPGEIFDTGKIRAGLEALRRNYHQRGLRDVGAIPDVQVDNANHTILLTIQLDEEEEPRVVSTR